MDKIPAYLSGKIIASNDSKAHALHNKSHFGEKTDDKIQYTLSEAFFLVEKDKMEIFSQNKKLSKNEIQNRLSRIDKRFFLKYSVFKDLREKGYIVKTALKFGADFRVYDKGKKPGDKHAKWIVFVEHESQKLAWHEFSAKNRVAHSTKKNLLIAIIDEEGDITYYEVRWVKP
ncbi:MAG: tRNA-intron lyase [archaeon]